ncbi:hypothetical protein OHA70_20445 [Kribbella sp. NBC_00382]|uniref:hypothetical protein n=1 Tax=Kribbella sp. NBC_00382 TaxID=2975967 RepID=UPI002E1D5D79
MSSYGPPGQPEQPQQPYPDPPPYGGPQQAPGPYGPGPYSGGPGQSGAPAQYPGGPGQQGQYPGGTGGYPPGPGRRRLSGVVVGVGVGVAAIALVVALLVVVVLVVNNRGSGGTAPAAGPNVATVGGTTTGQAKELTDALTDKGMDCSVRFTLAGGGQAGCFSWSEKGITSIEVLFQYAADGTVIGLNAKAVSDADGEAVTTLPRAVAAVAPVVFDADGAKVKAAVAQLATTDQAEFDGSWGKYKVRDGASGSTLSAAKSGANPLTVPSVQMNTTPATVADGLTAKGFTCTSGDADCNGTYRGGKGRLSVMTTTGLRSDELTYLLVGADDKAKDANTATTKKAFQDTVDTAFGLVQGGGVPDVKKWIGEHLDGHSHSAYVGGWRVDLKVTYDSPFGAQNVPTYYRAITFTDTLWTVPS